MAASKQPSMLRETYLSKRVAALKPSPIRKFFDIVATMKDVISLGIGEPDFTTPDRIVQAGVQSLWSRSSYKLPAGILGSRISQKATANASAVG